MADEGAGVVRGFGRRVLSEEPRAVAPRYGRAADSLGVKMATYSRGVRRGLIFFLGAWLACTAVAASATPREAEVLAAERARIAALVADDFVALERIFADELTYGHSNGTLENKAEYLATLRSGRLKYLELRHSDETVRISGDTALLTGTSAIKARAGGSESRAALRFLIVYVRRDGHWKCAAWQSARLP